MTEVAKKKRMIWLLPLALVIAVAGYGYIHQSASLRDGSGDAQAAGKPNAEQAKILQPKPTDLIIGDPNAIVTIVEYASLSCTHCAHFYGTVFPTLKSEYITPGKVKFVFRHFPLNEPAMVAAQLVECSGTDSLKREQFVKTLFDLQNQWAFDQSFLQHLKQIVAVGGMDAAAVESCVNNKAIETRILTQRQQGESVLHVNATPTFFVNGRALEGSHDLAAFRQAIAEAMAQK